MILSLIKSLLSVVSSLTRWAETRQLLNAGEARNVLRSIDAANANIQKARDARASVKHDIDSVFNDPHNRDRQ